MVRKVHIPSAPRPPLAPTLHKYYRCQHEIVSLEFPSSLLVLCLCIFTKVMGGGHLHVKCRLIWRRGLITIFNLDLLHFWCWEQQVMINEPPQSIILRRGAASKKPPGRDLWSSISCSKCALTFPNARCPLLIDRINKTYLEKNNAT